MREFNIFGPVNPQRHYHVNRIAVKAALRERIERGRYMTLNAGRQTGKTTLFREIIAELAATGGYFGILLNFESLTGFDKSDFYDRLGKLFSRWCEQHIANAPDPSHIRNHGDFVDWLQTASRQLDKRCVLIIDEFDAISKELAVPILSQFRSRKTPGYLLKN